MTTDGAGYSVHNSYSVLRQYHCRDNIMSYAILTGRRRHSSCRGSGRHGRKPCKYMRDWQSGMTTDDAGYSVFNSYTILRQYHWRDNIMSHAILTGRRRRSSCRGSGRHGRKPCKYKEIDSQVWRQTAVAIVHLIVIVYYANIIVETTLCRTLYLPGEDDAPAAAGVADMVANPVSIERLVVRYDDRRRWL